MVVTMRGRDASGDGWREGCERLWRTWEGGRRAAAAGGREASDGGWTTGGSEEKRIGEVAGATK